MNLDLCPVGVVLKVMDPISYRVRVRVRVKVRVRVRVKGYH